MGKNETCPNCRSRIRKEDLLKNSILDNIIAITKIVGNYEKCKTHSKNLELYCVKCDKKLCSDCLIMETKKCEHFLVRNEEVGNEIFKEMVRDQKMINKTLEYYKEELIPKIEKKNKELKNRKKKDLEFIDALKKMTEKRYEELLNDLEEVKLLVNSKMKELERISEENKNNLKNFADNKNNEKYLIQIKQKQIEIHPFYNETPYKYSIVHYDISPILQMAGLKRFNYTIKNYRQIIKDKKEQYKIIEPSPFKIDFLTWSILIFPFGEGKQQNKSLGIVFSVLNLPKNAEPIEINYSVMLINQKDNNDYCMMFNSRFKKSGVYYGSNEMYDIDKLDKDGFINDEGDLVIQIGIKPNTLEDFIKTYKLYLSNL